MFKMAQSGFRRIGIGHQPLAAQKFVATSIDNIRNGGISTYASKQFDEEWAKPEKQTIAKEITCATIVPTMHRHRTAALIQPPLPRGKQYHPAVQYVLGATYNLSCAIDKIGAISPEHFLLMRSAVGIARNPNAKILDAIYTIAKVLADELSQLSATTLASIFDIGSNIKESRSQDMLGNHQELLRIIKDHKSISSQQLLRALEVVLSPLGIIVNGYGGPRCKIAQAKQAGNDISELEFFINKIMTSLGSFHVPYIKSPGSPYAHLQMQAYKAGAQLSNDELVTVSHYLECCSSKRGTMPEIPQIRSTIVSDPTGRTMHLHDHINIPHFFDVSGTTGALMQAALGFLHLAGRSDLVASPQDTIILGMVLAGCNFHKQGYHSLYEVLPALNWVNHHVWKKPFLQLTPIELLHAVSDSLKKCIEPSSQMAPLVSNALDLTTEHSILHYDLYKDHVRTLAQQNQMSITVI